MTIVPITKQGNAPRVCVKTDAVLLLALHGWKDDDAKCERY